ncbi:hypothetical protein HRbin23_01475 [bacterium HR23]|uniref:Uncharacterized protein n=1 Tax=uncultured prokaryote TaxID=198431 RepID=H5SLC8_9ZZZZ|nr:hypothetical protein HGMM_F46A05C03 [uncultured prokaryote]GBD11796.1 hypothetical protein HRbin23_01475 [bacterium HR23]
MPDRNALCREADRFAAAVLMQKEVFVPYLLQTGFDLLAVRHQFHRSYASVIYRARELLGDRLDFLIALYERVAQGPPDTWP